MIKQSARHLYERGQTVLLDPNVRYFLKSDATFTVLAQLPPSGNDLQYRIKSAKEPHERVVLEHQLTRVPVGTDTAGEIFREKTSEKL